MARTFNLRTNVGNMVSVGANNTIIPDDNVVAFFNPTLLFTPKVEEASKEKLDLPKFKLGDHFFLQTEDCEGFEILKREYEVKGVVTEYNDTTINGVVMKQVSGGESTSFTMSKSDCKKLDIPYERGLMLMPMELGWVHNDTIQAIVNEVKETEKKFTTTDLSTYPVDYETRKIRRMTIKISGLSMRVSTFSGEQFITLPNSRTISVRDFLNNLRVVYHNGAIRQYVPCRCITPVVTRKTHDVIDCNGNMYLEIGFEHITNGVGLNPEELSGLEASDIFKIFY